ncbi:MAG: S-layer homology domain-containing protein [Chloroflexi bacterium]|nr:S-layer homology domain-containing protein [Chloroflexota bacterium]
MTRRLFGSLILASALALVLLLISALSRGNNASAGPAYAASGAKAFSTALAQGKQGATNQQPQTGTWADIAPWPTVTIQATPGSYPLQLKRAGAAAYEPNGKVYVLGGRHGLDGQDYPLQWIWEYTPGDPGTIVQKNALLDGAQVGSRYTANMVVAALTDASGPRIYAIGGDSIDSIPTPGVRVYDPNADAVSVLTSDPWPASPVRIPGGYAVVNNKLYVFGGFSQLGSGSVFSDTWQFDPMAAEGSRWTQLTTANLNLGRGFIAGAALDGKIYAIGGDTWNPSTRQLVPVVNVERLDPSQRNPTWTTIASLPTARGDMGAWAYDSSTNYEISGKIAVAGGVYPVPDATGYLYDPVTNSWSSFPSMIHATRDYGVAQLDGYLYAMGGYDYSGGIPNGANFNQRYDATTPLGTPTNTATGTLPTSTPTNTVTNTPSATPTSCGTGSNYAIATSTATIVPGTTDTGSSCDDCDTSIALPFSYKLYGQTYTTVNASSNGRLDFPSDYEPAFSNVCLPASGFDYTIFPYWDDQRTDNFNGTGEGIFTSVSGTAPNRIFNIEWRTELYSTGTPLNYEVRLYEDQSTQRFDVIYGALSDPGTSATVGVQGIGGSNQFTQFECNTGGLTAGLQLTFTLPGCATAVATQTPTPVVPTATPAVTATATCPPSTGAGSWTPAAPYPVNIARYAFAQDGDNFYVISGVSDGSVVTTVSRYNVGTGTWTSLASIPVGSEAPAAAVYNGKIYVVPGYSKANFFYIYDIASNTWASGASYPGSRYGEAVGVYNGLLYAVGGGSGGPTSTSYVYNIADDTWAPGPATPSPYLLGGYKQIGQYLYMVGSYGSSPSAKDAAPASSIMQAIKNASRPQAPDANSAVSMRLDMATATFSTGPAWTMQRADFGLAVQGNTLYALGGDANNGGYFDGTTEVDSLDVSAWPSGSWTTSPPDLPSARQANQAGFSSTGEIWSTGGITPAFAFIPDHIYRTQGGGGCATGTSTATAVPTGTSTTQATATTQATGTSTLTAIPTGTSTTQATSTTGATETTTTGPTSTPGGPTETETATAGATATVCNIVFTDVPADSTFYPYIECLACRGIISGYECGGPGEPCDANNNGYFRPYNPVTRGQIAKIVSNSAGFQDDPGDQYYEDVPPGSPFYQYINRLTHRGFMGGYPCGEIPQEPCVGPDRPYFRPGANATRGQLSKIVSNTAGIQDDPGAQYYEDVPPGNPFYVWINRLTHRQVMSGYECGSEGEPCVPPDNMPYFRPFNNVTRGETTKIDANTFFPECAVQPQNTPSPVSVNK